VQADGPEEQAGRIMMACWEAAKVNGLDPIATSSENSGPLVCHANACLMAASVANNKGFGAAVDGRYSHGCGVVLLRVGCTFDAPTTAMLPFGAC
jgi:hypothetical protein